MSLLKVRGLQTAFSTADGLVTSVRGISLDLGPGETLGLVGESGSGKTVTALSILRLLPPTARIVSGEIEVGGRNVLAASRRELLRIRGRVMGMVFQDSMTSLNPLVAVGTQLTEGPRVHRGLSARQAHRRSIELLEEVGVPEPAHRMQQFPHQLSGGLRQRVAIAIALGSNPSLLIADEPTTALDVTIQAQIIELLKREQRDREMGVVLITHDLGVVAGMADRVAVMYAGRIVETGPTDTVFAEPQHPYTESLLRSVPRLDGALSSRLPAVRGAPPSFTELPGGCPFHPRCDRVIARCRSEVPQLAGAPTGGAAACHQPSHLLTTVDNQTESVRFAEADENDRREPG